MRLPELQRLCAASIASPGDNTRQQQFSSHIRQSSIENATRIAVYQNNTIEIARGALSNVYPTVEQLVGEACFRSLAQSYMNANPSRSGDLQSYGSAFPALLGELYSDTEHDYLRDVARLEFALDECLTKEYKPGISGEQLQNAISGETDLHFASNPSLYLVESRYPILTIWRAHHGSGQAKLSLDAGGQNVALVRLEDEAQMTSISNAGVQLIRALAANGSLNDAVDDPDETHADELVQALQDAVKSAAFTEITPRVS